MSYSYGHIKKEANLEGIVQSTNKWYKLLDIFVSGKLQFNNEKYCKGKWKKIRWHALFGVSNHIQGSFSS